MPHLQAASPGHRVWLVMAMAAALVLAPGGVVHAQGGEPPADTGRVGSIVGTLRDEDGNPVAGAQFFIGSEIRGTSDSTGAFALHGLPAGLVTLTVRRLGYRPLVSQWQVTAGTLKLDLQLSPVPASLPAVVVQSRSQPYDARLAGFNARRAKKIGYYITRQDIERLNTFRMTDALRRIPGVRVRLMPRELGTTVTLPGSRCPPLVLVDGFPASQGRFDLNMIDLTTVEGIEVYPYGSTVPAELMGPFGMEGCGVIAIWSAPMRPHVRANQLPPKPVDIEKLLAENTVYLPDAVQVQAKYVPGSAKPLYPDSLYQAGVPGKVVARFVVDTSGYVEPNTIHIVSSTDSAFSKAVRDALPGALFHPAVLQGKPVRAVVQLPFDFRRTPADSSGRP